MKLVVIAGLVALLVTLLGTPLLIRFLRKHGYSQAIRVSTETVNYPEHMTKVGTPSMGGLAILIALVVGYSVSHLYVWQAPTASGLLATYARSTTQRKPMVAQRSVPGQVSRNFAAKLAGCGPPSAYQ